MMAIRRRTHKVETTYTAEVLRESAKLFEQKDKEYGSSHLRHGHIMKAFFPEGITLETEEDFYLYHIFELQIIKLNRIAEGKMRGEEHIDSHRDLTVYGAMGAARVNSINEKGPE